METLPTVFNFEIDSENRIEIRTLLIDNEPWFVAADVCLAIEIDDVRQACDRLDAEERGVCPIPTPGGQQKIRCINESGLYNLVLGSRKPESKKFKKWITSEVLPTIRKTGSYSIKPQLPEIPKTYAAALRLAAEQAEQIERLALENAKQAEQITLDAPKVEFVEEMATPDASSISFRDMCKKLSVLEPIFRQWLLDQKITFWQIINGKRTQRPYKEFVMSGYFELKSERSPSGYISENLYYTGAGQLWLFNKWKSQQEIKQ